MDLFGVFEIAAAGMSAEQSRLAAAASNLANSRTSKTVAGDAYQPVSVVVRSTTAPALYTDVETQLQAAQLPRPVVTAVTQSSAAPRLVYDPGHPDADERGFVSLPQVDTLATMLDLISVSRSYDSNLRVFDITRNLIQRTIEMGEESMSIEAVALTNAATVGVDLMPARTGGVGPVDAKLSVFETLLDGAASLNQQMQANEQSLQALALGETDNLHRVIMNLESTKLSFDLMLQVRNKLLDAYQELMRQQV